MPEQDMFPGYKKDTLSPAYEVQMLVNLLLCER